MNDHIQQAAAEAAERLRWLAQGSGTNITIIREGADMIDRLAANQVTPEIRAAEYERGWRAGFAAADDPVTPEQRAVLDAAEEWRNRYPLWDGPLRDAVDARRAATPKDKR